METEGFFHDKYHSCRSTSWETLLDNDSSLQLGRHS